MAMTIEKTVAFVEKGFVGRALRASTPIRKHITPEELLKSVVTLPETDVREAAIEELTALATELEEATASNAATATPPAPPPTTADSSAVPMETTPTTTTTTRVIDETPPPPEPLSSSQSKQPAFLLQAASILVTTPHNAEPEVETYILYLVAGVLCREKRWASAARVASLALPRLTKDFQGRRSLEPLGAKICFYLAHAHEKLGKFDVVKPALLAAHRTACLRHNEHAQAVLLNALVRGLLEANLVDAAFKLISKTTFPENVSNNQFCRYLYYTGRIQAMQLDYTDAYTKLTQSMRKAPANTGLGFRRAVHALAVLVQLLMGELPARAMFEGSRGLRVYMEPYLRLTRAVRRGSLFEFENVLRANAKRFARDKTTTLAVRLSQNVVKTGLRRLNVSYSRISLHDVAEKLQLESIKSAECVVAKAIKDGVIDAVVDHDAGHVRSKDVADVYATNDPHKAFHRRIAFCLDVHNEAVKAMAYPPDAHKKPKVSSATDDDDDDDQGPDFSGKTDEELAKEIEDELGDDL